MPFLLERLAARPAGLDGKAEAFDETAAIAAQIQRLFASRGVNGSGASAVIRWGLPNVVEMGYRDMVALGRYAELARRAIVAHEPRLKDVVVTVELQDDALTPVHLLVTAMRADNGDACSFFLPISR